MFTLQLRKGSGSPMDILSMQMTLFFFRRYMDEQSILRNATC